MIDVMYFAEKLLIEINEILMKLSNWNFIFNYCWQANPYAWWLSIICEIYVEYNISEVSWQMKLYP